MVRIDKLAPGSMVELRFDRSEETERAVFIGVKGEGDDRRATFVQGEGDSLFSWEAYRFQNRWCYGSSAGSLSVAEVVDEFSLRS